MKLVQVKLNYGMETVDLDYMRLYPVPMFDACTQEEMQDVADAFTGDESEIEYMQSQAATRYWVDEAIRKGELPVTW